MSSGDDERRRGSWFKIVSISLGTVIGAVGLVSGLITIFLPGKSASEVVRLLLQTPQSVTVSQRSGPTPPLKLRPKPTPYLPGSAQRAKPPEPPSGVLDWDVRAEKNKLTDAITLSATAKHRTDDGGSVYVTGTCDYHSISLEFEYHAKTDADTYYETQGTGQFVHIRYRLDSDDVLEAVSSSKYKNVATLLFVYPVPQISKERPPSHSPETQYLEGVAMALFLGVAPQDLRKFLHANVVRIELPLGGGLEDTLKIDVRDSGFQRFISACKIDVRRFDADAESQSNAANTEPQE